MRDLALSCTNTHVSSLSMATPLDAFLQPLSVDVEKIHNLARSLRDTFLKLALSSRDQFLPTPISDKILRPEGDESGRYV